MQDSCGTAGVNAMHGMVLVAADIESGSDACGLSAGSCMLKLNSRPFVMTPSWHALSGHDVLLPTCTTLPQA